MRLIISFLLAFCLIREIISPRSMPNPNELDKTRNETITKPRFSVVVEDPQALFEGIQEPYLAEGGIMPVYTIGRVLSTSGLFSEIETTITAANEATLVFSENQGWVIAVEAKYQDPKVSFWPEEEADELHSRLKRRRPEMQTSLEVQDEGYSVITLRDIQEGVQYEIRTGWISEDFAWRKHVEFLDQQSKKGEIVLYGLSLTEIIKESSDKLKKTLEQIPNPLKIRLMSLQVPSSTHSLIPFETTSEFAKKIQRWVRLVEEIIEEVTDIKGATQPDILIVEHPAKS